MEIKSSRKVDGMQDAAHVRQLVLLRTRTNFKPLQILVHVCFQGAAKQIQANAYSSPALQLKLEIMTPVGFESTQLALAELESTPLNQSGKVSLATLRFRLLMCLACFAI